MELKCTIQSYDWGKRGIDSTITSLLKAANPDLVLDDNKPYAEMWMGTHPNGPSFLKGTDISLKDYIKENSHLLGEEVEKTFGSQLPFLLKVLSIGKALSIQAHPNKEKAKELHQKYPNIYKDENHKPELAIALTPFEALCGFRPINEIKWYLKNLPELRAVVGLDKMFDFKKTDESDDKQTLKTWFHNLMTCDPGIIALQLRNLLDSLPTYSEATKQLLHASLLERLHSDYPGDVGCFCIYFLNFLTMQPGEAIYLRPNEPHAYLSGDCMECMACSDNVVRTGLTSKLKDVPTLIEMLSYISESTSSKRFHPLREDECTELYRPPVSDFAIAKITICPGRPMYKIIPRSSASILIIVNGKGEIPPSRILDRGSVLFISANEKIEMKVLCGCHPMLMFHAFANV